MRQESIVVSESSPLAAAIRPGTVPRRLPLRLPGGHALTLADWWVACFGLVPVPDHRFAAVGGAG